MAPGNVDRLRDINPPIDETCNWIFRHPNYLNWPDQAPALLWIKGNAGSGKSTLKKHLLQGLSTEESSIVVSFFFNKRASHGKKMQRTTLGFFQSIHYQLLEEIPDAMSSLTKAFLE